MLQTFDCPKCGGPVSYESEGPLDPKRTVRCTYCNSSLYLPDRLHGQPARIVPITINASNLKIGKWVWLIFGIPFIVVIVVVLAMAAGIIAPILYSVDRATKRETNRPTLPIIGGGKAEDSYARVALRFGSEGIGPGMFNDARSIAVDGEGRIYVGEYTGGRIQVFDASGKFISQWSIGDRKTLLRGMSADRKGTVYVVHGGDIYRYDGPTGNLLGKLEYEQYSGFDDITCAADGGLVAASYRNRDDIVRFNSSGQAVKTIQAAISSASGDSELNTRVAVDGAGNIYALGTFNDAVFKFTPDGKFENRFGGEGNEPGQFRATSAIAVDGKGRVFVSDIKGIQVFDSSGRFIRLFQTGGPASGMVFNDNNELFVVARKEVLKLVLSD
jgi:streptogramin lyase